MNFQNFKSKCDELIRGKSSTQMNGYYTPSHDGNIDGESPVVEERDLFQRGKERTRYQSKQEQQDAQEQVMAQQMASMQGQMPEQGYYGQAPVAPMQQTPDYGTSPYGMQQGYGVQQPQSMQQPHQQPYGQPPAQRMDPYAQSMQQMQAPQQPKAAPLCTHYVFHLYSREQCKDVIPYIRYNISVVINLEYITSAQEQQRCLDILCGAAYALNCTITNVLKSIVFMISPPNMHVEVVKWDKQRSNPAEQPQVTRMQPMQQPMPRQVAPEPVQTQMRPSHAYAATSVQPTMSNYVDVGSTMQNQSVDYGSGTPSERFQRQRRPEGV